MLEIVETFGNVVGRPNDKVFTGWRIKRGGLIVGHVSTDLIGWLISDEDGNPQVSGRDRHTIEKATGCSKFVESGQCKYASNL